MMPFAIPLLQQLQLLARQRALAAALPAAAVVVAAVVVALALPGSRFAVASVHLVRDHSVLPAASARRAASTRRRRGRRATGLRLHLTLSALLLPSSSALLGLDQVLRKVDPTATTAPPFSLTHLHKRRARTRAARYYQSCDRKCGSCTWIF